MVKARSNSEKVRLFSRLFSGLTHVYGTYDIRSGVVRQVKAPVTEKVVYSHLKGQVPYGVYLLCQDRTRALAVDFDDDDPAKPIDYVQRAEFYNLPTYIERSKSKGYHVWVFFKEAGVIAWKARILAKTILGDLGLEHIEIFPKQDRLDSRNRYGNFINAPLFGRHVARGRTLFTLSEYPDVPYPDQWEFLETVVRLTESDLNTVLEKHEIKRTSQEIQEQIQTSSRIQTNEPVEKSYGLPICAQRMLQMGVDSFQRVSCFRLAINLRKCGLPKDIAVAALKRWALKNRPNNGKAVITDQEIEAQTAYAYERKYQGLGCDDQSVQRFCDPDCHLRKRIDQQPTNRGDHDDE